jgi:hypothetical protein
MINWMGPRIFSTLLLRYYIAVSELGFVWSRLTALH